MVAWCDCEHMGMVWQTTYPNYYLKWLIATPCFEKFVSSSSRHSCLHTISPHHLTHPSLVSDVITNSYVTIPHFENVCFSSVTRSPDPRSHHNISLYKSQALLEVIRWVSWALEANEKPQVDIFRVTSHRLPRASNKNWSSYFQVWYMHTQKEGSKGSQSQRVGGSSME